MEVVYRQLILMLNRLYSTSHVVVLSNIRAYSDYDFSNGHRMQSGGRKGILFYLMEMDCMLSTSGWLVCKYELGEANSVYTSYIISSASNGKIQAGALIFVLVGYINRFKIDVKEMKDVFVSVEKDLDETFKQNELLKDKLLEASLDEDIKNLVITSCMESRNKDLHDETRRISKESKDVSNESTTADTVCNDAFEVIQELPKRIVELEKDLSKFKAKSIAFEIALQHMSRENKSHLKTLQK
ncbi:hypothetical protein Tco_0343382 [Tanacetum coccineum]